MKQWCWCWVFIAVLSTGIILCGCQTNDSEGDNMHKDEQHIEPEITNLPFQSLNTNQTPKQIQHWLAKKRSQQANKVFIENGKTYVIVQLGQKSTGGYHVAIKQIQLEHASSGDKIITVNYQVQAPKQGSFNTQALTYPLAIAVLDKEYHMDFQFKKTNETNKLKES
ncbi:protease complex subunit PrcB family protein [Lentibacillus sp. N15]|uniref:protease complex subunit PrcB family protein n=1 Tax=Lentibacillus songyuanensis TaxID=3136161 RepID=UPI0031B9E325